MNACARWGVVGCLVIGALGAAASAVAAEWNVGRLMQGLAEHGGGKALFAEKKYIAVLDRPVESSGELFYRPPDRLEKRTFKPNPESLVLEGNALSIERGKQKVTLQLQQYPEITAIVGSIRNTLAGNLPALERQFRVVAQGSQERWTLTLLPSDPQIATIVQRIEITGARDELRQIEVLQTDGDRSVMQVRRAAPP